MTKELKITLQLRLTMITKTKRFDDPRIANFATDNDKRVFLDATFGPNLNQLVEDESSELSFSDKRISF